MITREFNKEFLIYLSRSRIVDLVFFYFLSYFHFHFDLFLYFLLIELRVRVEVMIGHTVTSVTSDGIVTVIVIDHKI